MKAKANKCITENTTPFHYLDYISPWQSVAQSRELDQLRAKHRIMKEIVAPAIELHQQFRRTQEVLRQSRPSSVFNSLSRESKTLSCSSRGKETKNRMKNLRNQRRTAKSQFYQEKGQDTIIFAKKHQPFLRVKVATLGDTPNQVIQHLHKASCMMPSSPPKEPRNLPSCELDLRDPHTSKLRTMRTTYKKISNSVLCNLKRESPLGAENQRLNSTLQRFIRQQNQV